MCLILWDVLTKQAQSTAKNGLKLYSASSGGSENTTSSNGSHTHDVGYGSTRVGLATNAKAGTDRNIVWNNGSLNLLTAWSAGSHAHNVYLRGDTETRPDNFTVKIWKRTA